MLVVEVRGMSLINDVVTLDVTLEVTLEVTLKNSFKQLK